MDAALQRSLQDKVYEKRKNAALDLEKLVRESVAANDVKKLHHVIGQLCEMAASPHSNSRSGAIMGLAGASIALGHKIAEYLGAIIPPILSCFNDADSKVRYFACESMYNVAKVAKGEILIFFNELFDAMSKVSLSCICKSVVRLLTMQILAVIKLAADTELPVKNGAELLDRLIKDIVTEQASTYVSVSHIHSVEGSHHASTSASSVTSGQDENDRQDFEGSGSQHGGDERAFSLPRFIPLLQERIYVLNPFTRAFLVSWLTVLDSVPELELVSFLPDFLDGLLKFLADPNLDIRITTQNVLADFLKEIREIAQVQQHRDDEWRRREELYADQSIEDRSRRSRNSFPGTTESPDASAVTNGLGVDASRENSEVGGERQHSVEEFGEEALDQDDDFEEEGSGEWIPGQDVHVDHGAIVEILLQHLSSSDEEIQSVCLRWIAEFLLFVQPVMVPFVPRLIPVILSSLPHQVPAIRTAANDTNYNLYKVIQDLPDGNTVHSGKGTEAQGQGQLLASQVKDRDRNSTNSPPQNQYSYSGSRLSSLDRLGSNKDSMVTTPLSSRFDQALNLNDNLGSAIGGEHRGSRSSVSEVQLNQSYIVGPDPFDYGATVNALTLQFLNELEETRVAALEWLLMLHRKAPKKILAVDDPSVDTTRNKPRVPNIYDGSESGLTIALLLKMLSDPSERVLRYDLQLLAQISSSSEDNYFPSFMMNLLSLFSTDRRLLETRGSLIIRQLCLSLNTERIYRTFAEILEKDEDLEFASIMVQNLNLIMITSPELADFRKRLRTLESKDGQALFTVLYRSWSHNAVATFALCLLAQAYEQACSLLQIFAELEITVSLLIQIDKLVQLLESPVFTSLRLQLLEPDRYPYLLKAMYGLLMLLPQSSAFATLRNRLSAVSSLGLIQTAPKSYTGTSTSTSSRSSTINTRRGDDIRWTELLTHFRQVQKRRSSAASLGGDTMESVSGGQAGALGPGGRGSKKKIAPGIGRQDSSGIGVATRASTTKVGQTGVSTRPGSPNLQAKRRMASAPQAKKM